MVYPDGENANAFDVYFEFYPFDPEIIYQHYADLKTESRSDFMAFVYFKENIFRPSVEGYSRPTLITTIA